MCDNFFKKIILWLSPLDLVHVIKGKFSMHGPMEHWDKFRKHHMDYLQDKRDKAYDSELFNILCFNLNTEKISLWFPLSLIEWTCFPRRKYVEKWNVLKDQRTQKKLGKAEIPHLTKGSSMAGKILLIH